MPLKLGLPSDVRAGPDAGPVVERTTAIAIPAPTAAERMTIAIIEPLIRLAMANLLECYETWKIRSPAVARTTTATANKPSSRFVISDLRVATVYQGRCRHHNPRRINVKLTPFWIVGQLEKICVPSTRAKARDYI